MEPLAGCIAAGLPVRTACAAVVQSFDGSVADDLGQVLSLMDLGVADAEAWRTLHEHPQLGLVAADLSRSSSREPRWWRACNTTPRSGGNRDESHRRAICQIAGLDDALPFVDARIADGNRVHAVLGTLASPGACIPLRVPAHRGFFARRLCCPGLRDARNGATPGTHDRGQTGVVIRRGTGSGKTTCDYDTPSKRESDASRRFDPCPNTRPDRRITLAALTQSVLDLASEMTRYLS
jgi:hypothetical protein